MLKTQTTTLTKKKKPKPLNSLLPAAGVDVRADDNDRPPAEVEVTGKANGVAEPAGLLKPKLKPVVAADVVAGVPKRNPKTIITLRTCCLRMNAQFTFSSELFPFNHHEHHSMQNHLHQVKYPNSTFRQISNIYINCTGIFALEFLAIQWALIMD